MHLAPVAAPEYVATVNFRGGDWRVSADVDVLGDAGGYASVEAAVAAARPISDGIEVGAAGVFALGGRYVLRRLSSEYFYSTRPGQLDAAEPYTHLELLTRTFGGGRLGEIRIGSDPTGATFPTSSALRAIVDGPALLAVA